jgi:hypothetical protein
MSFVNCYYCGEPFWRQDDDDDLPLCEVCARLDLEDERDFFESLMRLATDPEPPEVSS